ncbi:MAG: imidazole glycerol phosphate synthase subunit HisF [Chloroflexi bacterium]|nr:imidazole glycerol phosphate synthase subunit HisF [Chloroflexota bacterium]
MLMPRVMPCLLLKDGSLVKTIKFKDPGYIGDPINAIRIYNEKEVDELIFLDITATIEAKRPPFKVLSEIASECFMPVAYGGGIRHLEDIQEIFSLGIEKVVINTYAAEKPDFVRQAADKFGTQSIVASIDVRKKLLGRYEVYTQGGRKGTGLDPVAYAIQMQQQGAGEIMLTAIDRDGTQEGYDIELLRKVTAAVDVPVIASGGAGKVTDFGLAVKEGGASACAAGSMVVYYGRNRAVLINFPTRAELEAVLEGTY